MIFQFTPQLTLTHTHTHTHKHTGGLNWKTPPPHTHTHLDTHKCLSLILSLSFCVVQCWHREQCNSGSVWLSPLNFTSLFPLYLPSAFSASYHQRTWQRTNQGCPTRMVHLDFFFFFAFPSYISGVHLFGVRFLRMWPFFNPTIKVVTFRLRGWCVLGVFLLPAFTRLGHERQDLWSPCDEMHVCTD